jgi:DNA-binding transcriptional ArsR family regulator
MSGRLVIDVDPRNGGIEAFAAMLAREGIEVETFTVQTGGGGFHYYYLAPDDLGEINKSIAHGVECKGVGGYVLGVGSLHISGARYEVASSKGQEAVKLPDALRRLVEKPARPPRRVAEPRTYTGDSVGTRYGRRALEEEVAAVRGAPEGQRNETLNRAAFSIGQIVAGGQLEAGVAEHELREAALDAGLGQREVETTLASGFEAGLAEPRSAPEKPPPPPALGLEMRDLFPEGGGGSFPRETRATDQHSSFERGCALAAYASAKGLPVAFLESLGVTEFRFMGAPAVRFPYLDVNGEETCVRFRVSLDGDQRIRTKSGAKHCLYGLNRLHQAHEAGYVIVSEGESDTQTLWFAGYPALGLPGSNNWREDRDAEHLEAIPVIYVIVEPDRGGEAVLRWVGASSIRDQVRLVLLQDAKDPSDLYLSDRDGFRERLEQALMAAAPWAEHDRIVADVRARAAWRRCESLAGEGRILDLLAKDLAAAGLAGEERAAKILYLITTSRLLRRPVSAAVKGPSAGGKSFLVETVTSFFPPSAFYSLTAMSEHALAYGTEPLVHRHLILYEAAGLESDFATYLIRSLLSEGHVRYETVEKTGEGLRPRLIEREGPTGLITTTTKLALHPENETRLWSIPITDSPEQTKDVFRVLAADETEPPDLTPWVALQEWLAEAEHRVAIPYADVLAELVPPVAVRLRRDFGALLNLIRAHALLHQVSRQRDGRGRIVATLDDYEVVRDLVAEVVSEGVEATVPQIVRETVQAVAAAAIEEGISVAQLARALKIDKATASRRWTRARDGGYLKNREDRRGKPARIVLADPLPDDMQVLPSLEDLSDRCAVDRVAEGVTTPVPPRQVIRASSPSSASTTAQAT